MDNEQSETPIVNLATGEPVTQIKRDDRTGYCMSHCQSVLVDQHTRRLTCRECGAVVDAFDWANKMAKEESYLLQRIGCLKVEVVTHGTRVSELEAEEKRIKARIREAKNSLLKSAGV